MEHVDWIKQICVSFSVRVKQEICTITDDIIPDWLWMQFAYNARSSYNLFKYKLF